MDAKLLAETIFREYNGGDASADSGLKIQDFQLAVKKARAYKVRYDYFNTVKIQGERIINSCWLKQYKNVEVLFDDEIDSYYSVLPTQVLDLPHSLGLYHISPMKNNQAPFAQQTIGESYIFSANPTDTITYHFDDERIYYDNFDIELGKVYIQLVPLVDDDVPDEFTTEITELVLNRFLKTKSGGLEVQDKLDDNNPNRKEVANG